MALSTDEVNALEKKLNSLLKDGIWETILMTLAVTGAATNQHLIQATRLGRDKLRRTLEKMSEAAIGMPPLFLDKGQGIRRAGERGSASRLFMLGESGAALCRKLGVPGAHACKLDRERAITHALGILDVHLLARGYDLGVVSDSNIRYNGESFIRPDNVVNLDTGMQIILESEQDADSDYINRMVTSLNHKQAFFCSEASAGFSPVVRILIDLPDGETYRKTLYAWAKALEVCSESAGEVLSFKLAAMRLGDFIAEPDWSLEPDMTRWVDVARMEPEARKLTRSSLAELAHGVPEFETYQKRLILAAQLQHIYEICDFRGWRFPDREFLLLIRDIYSASHNENRTPFQRCWIPNESLFLLDQYLRIQPELRAVVDSTIHSDSRRIHWNQSTALHRMQVVVDAFLEYHGLQADGPLSAYPFTPDYAARGPRRFSVAVEINDPYILWNPEIGRCPDRKDIQFFEKSLAWVLSSLFSASHYLGYKKPPFW